MYVFCTIDDLALTSLALQTELVEALYAAFRGKRFATRRSRIAERPRAMLLVIEF